MGAFIYDVRWFLGIFDLPTYPNQILDYYISPFSKIRCSLTYLPKNLTSYVNAPYVMLYFYLHNWLESFLEVHSQFRALGVSIYDANYILISMYDWLTLMTQQSNWHIFYDMSFCKILLQYEFVCIIKKLLKYILTTTVQLDKTKNAPSK